MASRSELAAVLSSASFRRLFSVRITGQFCDGFFQSALATFVLFSPERQPSAASIAIAFAVLYLPYSLVGPFVGVLLDRWQRRQVLLVANLLRAIVILAVALLTWYSRDGLDLALAVLVALGLNRFILAALSAALPHTVKDEALVTANALSPTAGTIFAAIGGLCGVVFQRGIGGGDSASTTVLVLAAVGFAASGLLALRLGRTALGPSGDAPTDSVSGILGGLKDGAQLLWRTQPAYRSIAAVTLCRVAFGVSTALVIVMVRNLLNAPTEPDAALAQITIIVGGAAGGALLAAIFTPTLVRRLGPVVFASTAMGVAGLVMAVALPMTSVTSFIVGALFLGFASQGTKICADTITQQFIPDDYLGRVFTLYDIAVNVGLVVGVTFAALVAPATGETPAGFIVVCGLLIGTAAWYYIRRNQPRFHIVV